MRITLKPMAEPVEIFDSILEKDKVGFDHLDFDIV